MKKYLLYALCLCSLFCLSGCKEEDIFSRLPAYQGETVTPWGTQVQDPEPDNPYPLYIFPALDASQPDLAFHLTTPAAFSSAEEFTAAPGYSNRLIVAAIYSLQACTGCREQAPYFDRLAEEFANTQAEFVILFTDRDQEAVSQLPWVKEIKHAKVYYNAYDFCQQEACPIPTQPNAPFITWIGNRNTST